MLLSTLQLEYVFICHLALPLSHHFCWFLFLFCQAEKFSRISAMQKYGCVESWSSVASSLLINVGFTKEYAELLWSFVVILICWHQWILLFLFHSQASSVPVHYKTCLKINMLGLSIHLHFILIFIVTFCDLWPQIQGTGKEVAEIAVWLQIPALDSHPSINLRYRQ